MKYIPLTKRAAHRPAIKVNPKRIGLYVEGETSDFLTEEAKRLNQSKGSVVDALVRAHKSQTGGSI